MFAFLHIPLGWDCNIIASINLYIQVQGAILTVLTEEVFFDRVLLFRFLPLLFGGRKEFQAFCNTA